MSAQRRAATKERPPRSSAKSSQGVAPAKETKPKASQTQQQPKSGFAARWESLQKMARDTWAEIKKITWPDSLTVRNLTLLVIVMSTVLGILLGGIDFVLLRLFEAI